MAKKSANVRIKFYQMETLVNGNTSVERISLIHRIDPPEANLLVAASSLVTKTFFHAKPPT